MLTATKNKTKFDFINELRSGKYEQLTDGRMSDGRKVCAMGVFEILNGFPDMDAPTGGHEILGMPTKVFNRIAELNDARYGFDFIADILEKHLSEDLQHLNY